MKTAAASDRAVPKAKPAITECADNAIVKPTATQGVEDYAST
jgi:hypothetical protein